MAIAAAIGRDEGHVRHGLVRDQEPLRHGHEHEPAEQAGAAAEDLRDGLVEQVDGEEREEEDGQARGPLRPRHAALAHRREHLIGLVAHAEAREAQGLEPEVEDRLGPEPALLRPPERDPVVAREDLARHLAVVRLPWVAERVAAEHREVEQGGGEHQPEAVAMEQGARRSIGPTIPDLEHLAHAVGADDRGEEGRGDEQARGDHRVLQPAERGRERARGREGEAAVDGEGDEEDEEREPTGEEAERLAEVGEGDAAVDALVGVVEGADQIEDAEGGDEHRERAERDAEAQLALGRHEHEGRDRADREGHTAAQRAERIAFGQQRVFARRVFARRVFARRVFARRFVARRVFARRVFAGGLGRGLSGARGRLFRGGRAFFLLGIAHGVRGGPGAGEGHP
jgi:hypothetical protein